MLERNLQKRKRSFVLEFVEIRLCLELRIVKSNPRPLSFTLKDGDDKVIGTLEN